MKHKPIKRLLALLLVCTMFLGLLSVSASAEDTPTEPELKLVSTAEGSLKKGDTFTVEVQFPKDEEFSNFEFYFDFDLETFKLTAVNTSYQAELADGSTIELPYIPNLVVTPNTTSFRDEETGNTYGGAIASATGTLNTKATMGILFTMEFEALTCCTAPKNISIYNKNFQKSTDYSTFESITPVIIPAEITINHTLTAVPAKDATCTEDGNDAYWSCSACGKLFSDANGETEITTAPVISALGHDYGTPEYNWTQAENGYECTATRTCTRDNEHVETETVDAVYSVSSVATCTEDGEGLYTATFTNTAFAAQTKTVVLTALGHDYSVAQHNETSHWKKCSRCDSTTTPETHSFEAHSCDVAAKCTGCDYVKPATSHKTEHHARIEPTCTAAGNIEYWQCSVCGKKFSDAACTTEVQDTTLEKVPHSAGTVWEKDQNNHWHVCTICGTEVMDKAAHTYGDWTIIKDATETEAGSRKRTCTVCGYEQTEEISILRFTVTVHNGSGSGEYKSGDTVTITANRRSGYTFEKWTVNAGTVVLGKETDATTSFTMPAENVTVTATYRYNGGSGSGSGSSSGIVIKDENGKVIGKANPDTGIVELPITPVPAASSSRQAEEIEITIPKNTTVKVEIPVRNVTPGTVVAIVHADGTEEIVRTSIVTKNGIVLELDSSATVKVYDNSQSFSDVPATNWASDAVAFASSRELFNGTGAGTFSPNAPMTRQMLMTVLARLDGEDTSGNAYRKGMEWAIRNGVSNGSDPEGRITREQLATMLWRYAGSPSVSGRMSGFADTDQISSYAEDAMLWATKSGIIGGKGGNQLDPKGYATRAEVAAMLMRYCNTLFTK